MWRQAHAAVAAQDRLIGSAGDPALFGAKLKTARLYTDNLLPRTGADSTLSLAEGDF